MKRKALPLVAVSVLLLFAAGCASTPSREHHWAVGKWRIKQTVVHHDEKTVFKGKLRIEREEHRWEGKISFDATEKWEKLDDIHVSDDSIRFFRPEHHQEFRGRREGNEIKGTWETRGGKEREGKWEAERD